MEDKANDITYRVVQFTEYPGPRYIKQGEDSGEEFYNSKLKPLFSKAIENNATLTIDLDGTAGYASSFLDEAFGNLSYDFTKEVVKKHLKVISIQEPDWIPMIFNETLTEWERKRKEGIPRKPELLE